MTIKYLYREGHKACESEPLKISIDGISSGEIRKVSGGYQHFRFDKPCGEVRVSVALIQADLNAAYEAGEI